MMDPKILSVVTQMEYILVTSLLSTRHLFLSLQILLVTLNPSFKEHKLDCEYTAGQQ